jgi:hypothetical protein
VRPRFLVSSFAVTLLACGNPQPSPDQTAAAQQGNDATATFLETFKMADALFRFDPDINPGDTPTNNATTIRNNVTGANQSCATVSATNSTTFTATFAQGCTIGGVSISGTVAIAVTSPASGTISVSLTLTSVVVNSWDIAGTAAFSTSTGSFLSADLNLTHSGTTFGFSGTVQGKIGSITIGGTVNLPSLSTSATLTNVVVNHGDCWPSGGTLTTTVDGLTATVTFESSTATTGQATISYQTPAGATKPACYALPSFGSTCAAQACP